MIKANMEALKFYMNYEPEIRNSTPIYLDESTIHTGDFLAISRMDGIDPMIMMGTGSHIGHSAVAAWIDGELYVLESQDGPYWPTRGIQRTPFKKWVEQADISEFNVAILPMREEYRKKFNESKANEWFVNGIEGLPYGYEIFLWGWIDTVDSNMPWAITHLHFEFLFTVLEKIYPALADQMMAQSLNIRLGTKKLKLNQIIAEAARRGITFEELLAMLSAKDIDVVTLGESKMDDASYFGRVFARSGGLTEAVVEALKEQNSSFEAKPLTVDGLENCRLALLKAKGGNPDFNFIEGMGCVGGCVGGPCSLNKEVRSKLDVDKHAKATKQPTISSAIEKYND
jgi:hypothetical protein